jgi:hypothetical protein
MPAYSFIRVEEKMEERGLETAGLVFGAVDVLQAC